MTPPTVLVPLDGTQRATVALPVARVFADLAGATPHIVHVGERMAHPGAVAGTLGLTPEQMHGCVLDLAAGPPAARIVELAGELRSVFIVLCTHTASDKTRGALGRVAEEVLRNAPCPVVLVQPERGSGPWELRTILLPHDGTPTTAAAVAPVVDLAVRAGAELVVLHVAAPRARSPAEPGTLGVPRYVDQPQHEWSNWTREFLARLRALSHCPAGIRLRLVLGTGEPGAAIVSAAARGCHLAVLAWHGILDAEHGATVKTVIRDAACPVLVLRVES